jgi:tetratricopeptide (TPR) repeat protein
MGAVRATSIVGILGLILTVGSGAAYCQSPDSLFTRGCDLYEAGDFASALNSFQIVNHAGIRNAGLYYNLGNTHFRLESLGKAVANYRRAQMLDPRAVDVKANLGYVRTIVGTKDTLAALGFENPADLPLRWLSPKEIQAVFYVAYYVALLAFLGLLFFTGSTRRRSLYALIVLVVVAIASYAISARAISRFRHSSEAVVISEEADLRSGPGNAFERIATLRDGVEVRLKSRSAMWVEVELPAGEVGWLRDTDIEPI